MSAPEFICDPETDGTNSDGAVIINFYRKKDSSCGYAICG